MLTHSASHHAYHVTTNSNTNGKGCHIFEVESAVSAVVSREVVLSLTSFNQFVQCSLFTMYGHVSHSSVYLCLCVSVSCFFFRSALMFA